MTKENTQDMNGSNKEKTKDLPDQLLRGRDLLKLYYTEEQVPYLYEIAGDEFFRSIEDLYSYVEDRADKKAKEMNDMLKE